VSRSNAGGPVLTHSPPIVAIAQDSALLRSLAFALQAHGYKVEQFLSWKAATNAAGRARNLVIDGRMPAADLQACLSLAGKGQDVVLLAEDDVHYIEREGLHVLHKPLSGADVIAALAALRKDP
jgi:DNA-binding response OmpR family regulator